MSRKQIDAKPTTYRGTEFKSRLEARWAVFFDYHPLCNYWNYEPTKLELKDKGWDYTPDFLFGSAALASVFLEVKPTLPTPEYIGVLRSFAQVITADLYLGYGDFYKSLPKIVNLCEIFGTAAEASGEDVINQIKAAAVPLDKFPWLPSPKEAIEKAKTFRFDLPSAPPSFRDGSKGELQSHIRRWTAEQRRLRRKPRPRVNRQPRKRKNGT